MMNIESDRLVVSLKSIATPRALFYSGKTNFSRGLRLCRFSFRNPLKNRFQDRVRINALGFTFEIQNYAMSKRRQHNVTDVFEGHFRPAVQQCPNLSAYR